MRGDLLCPGRERCAGRLVDTGNRREEGLGLDELVEALPLLARRVVDDDRRRPTTLYLLFTASTCGSSSLVASTLTAMNFALLAWAMTRGSEKVCFESSLHAPHQSAVKSTIRGRFSALARFEASCSECSQARICAESSSAAAVTGMSLGRSKLVRGGRPRRWRRRCPGPCGTW